MRCPPILSRFNGFSFSQKPTCISAVQWKLLSNCFSSSATEISSPKTSKSAIAATLRVPSKHFSSNETLLLDEESSEPLSDCSNEPPKAKYMQIVSPTPRKEDMKNWEKVVGIEIVTPSLSWVVLNTKRQEIVSCGRHQLLSDVKKLCPSTLLEIACSISKEIPRGDVYVVEDKTWTSNKTALSPLSLNVIIIQAMLAALFSPQMDAEHAVHNVFYMQRRVVSRLFQIKVGGERTSSQHIVRSMIQQSENADALPKTRDLAYKDANWLEPKPYTVLKWSSPELIKELWSRDDTYREGYCNAVLVACAFFDLICTANPEALSTVSVPSRTKKRKSGLDMS